MWPKSTRAVVIRHQGGLQRELRASSEFSSKLLETKREEQFHSDGVALALGLRPGLQSVPGLVCLLGRSTEQP